ncbi:MAG TPA: macro domain-containing protein, partial [Longimicrobiales bacterium]
GGNAQEAALLANAYRNSLRAAAAEGLRTIAFPSVSTGAYGYPIERAARVALHTIIEELRAHPERFDEVRLVLFSQRDLAVYRDALQQIMQA